MALSWVPIADYPSGLGPPDGDQILDIGDGKAWLGHYGGAVVSYYDPATDTWTAAPDPIYPVNVDITSGLPWFSYGGHLRKIAGVTGSGAYGVYQYNPLTGAMTLVSSTTASPPGQSYPSQSVMAGDVVWYIARDRVTSYNNVADTWTQNFGVDGVAHNVSDFGTGSDGTNIYLVEGFHNLSGLDERNIYKFDTSAHTWSLFATEPDVSGENVGREDCASFYFNGSLYVIGGVNYRALDDYYAVEVNSYNGSWVADTNLPIGRAAPAVGIVDGYIYVVGGYNDLGEVDSSYRALLSSVPSNDNLVDAITVTAGTTITFSNANSTLETNEASTIGAVGNNSVWFKWTSPRSGVASVDTSSTVGAWDSYIDVFTSSLMTPTFASLTLIAQNDNGGSGPAGTSLVQWSTPSTATTYYIRVNSYGADTRSNAKLHTSFAPTLPAVTSIVPTSTSSGSSVELIGTNLDQVVSMSYDPVNTGESDSVSFSISGTTVINAVIPDVALVGTGQFSLICSSGTVLVPYTLVYDSRFVYKRSKILVLSTNLTPEPARSDAADAAYRHSPYLISDAVGSLWPITYNDPFYSSHPYHCFITNSNLLWVVRPLFDSSKPSRAGYVVDLGSGTVVKELFMDNPFGYGMFAEYGWTFGDFAYLSDGETFSKFDLLGNHIVSTDSADHFNLSTIPRNGGPFAARLCGDKVFFASHAIFNQDGTVVSDAFAVPSGNQVFTYKFGYCAPDNLIDTTLVFDPFPIIHNMTDATGQKLIQGFPVAQCSTGRGDYAVVFKLQFGNWATQPTGSTFKCIIFWINQSGLISWDELPWVLTTNRPGNGMSAGPTGVDVLIGRPDATFVVTGFDFWSMVPGGTPTKFLSSVGTPQTTGVGNDNTGLFGTVLLDNSFTSIAQAKLTSSEFI